MCVRKGCTFAWLMALSMCGYELYICVAKGCTCVRLRAVNMCG